MQRGGRSFCSSDSEKAPVSKLLVAALMFAALVMAVNAQAQGAPDAAVRKLAEPCFTCHGPNGNSQNPDYPVLAGQSWRYVYIELRDFKEGRRSNPEMSPMAASLSREDMMTLGNFFQAQKPAPIAFKADGARVEAPSGRVRRPERDSQGGGPVSAVHQKTAAGLPRPAPDQ